MLPFRSRPGRLPFADAAFGSVLCLDVLEHVPPADRADFVAELARIAAHRVVVACPSSEMAPIDDLVRHLFVGSGQPVPGWLSEHDEHGLPTPEEIAAFCAAPAGFAVRPLRVPNALLSTMASVADFMPALAGQAVHEATVRTDDWLRVFDGASFGGSWRKGYVLERVDAPPTLVDQRDLEPTALAALRCQDCGGAFAAVEDDLLRCGGCARLAPRTPGRIWDLSASPFAGLATGDAPYVWCDPAWDDPRRLGATLHALSAGAGEAVVLRARPQAVSGEQAAGLAVGFLQDTGLLATTEVVVLDEPLTAGHERALRDGAARVAV